MNEYEQTVFVCAVIACILIFAGVTERIIYYIELYFAERHNKRMRGWKK